MYTTVSTTGVKSMTWIFNRTMRKSIQGLHVDEHSLAKVRALADQGKRVILMPIFKSFADAFILWDGAALHVRPFRRHTSYQADGKMGALSRLHLHEARPSLVTSNTLHQPGTIEGSHRRQQADSLVPELRASSYRKIQQTLNCWHGSNLASRCFLKHACLTKKSWDCSRDGFLR